MKYNCKIYFIFWYWFHLFHFIFSDTIRDEETFYGTLKLWKAMFNDLEVLPLPTLTRIIPIYHAYWNATKSGSDTTTKLIDHCATLNIPRIYNNCNTRMCGRVIMLALVLIHWLVALNYTKKDLNFTSLSHYRNACSKKQTFHKTLIWCKNVW